MNFRYCKLTSSEYDICKRTFDAENLENFTITMLQHFYINLCDNLNIAINLTRNKLN